MSSYIKINGLFDGDQEDATIRFTKVFRMSDLEGESAMSQICQNETWQFIHQTSDSQSSEAKTYLTSLGFDVELVPLSDIDWDKYDSTEPDDSSQEMEEAEKLPKGDPKKKQKMALAGLILVILAGVGLTQTQQGKELVSSFGVSSDTKKDSADSPSSNPTNNIVPIGTIALDGEPSTKYPMTLSGCLDNRNQLTSILRRADLEQTQSVALCKDKTISNPATEWKCEYQSLSKICNDREAYSCAMQYQCVPETAEYNRDKFKKALDALS